MQIVLDTHFNTLEQFIDGVQHFDLDFKLLGTGGFLGQVKQLISRDILIGYARFHRALDQAGTTPAGFRTFVIPGRGCHGFWWRGHSINKNDLLIFPRSNELHSSSGADFEVFTISIRETYLEQLADELGIAGVLENRHEVIHLNPGNSHDLRMLAESIVKSDENLSTIEASRLLAEKLALNTASDRPVKSPPLRKRDMALNRIIEYVRSTPAATPELAKLCRHARVSERTLQYAFKERYGIAPNTFVKRWKLNSVRQGLLLADTETDTVFSIAMDHGFHHQGQFAADYRDLFAELPSRTLERPSFNL